VHAAAVDVVALEPGPVVDEVPADRPDEHRAQPERAESERDVGRDPAAPHLEVLDQERQRELVELVHDQRVGEAPRERHQVVGGDRTGDEQRHDVLRFVRGARRDTGRLLVGTAVGTRR
jgi:hypothetical protein